MNRPAITDSVFGTLSWDAHNPGWSGEIAFTPKHVLRLLIIPDAQTPHDEFLAACHNWYRRIREREKEFRRATAWEVVDDFNENNPDGNDLTAVELALGIELMEIHLRPPFATLIYDAVRFLGDSAVIAHLREDGDGVTLEAELEQ